MTYYSRERDRLIAERDRIFKDPGFGVFARAPREFVLSEPASNLWPGIREDVLDYFDRNKISWWRGNTNEPTGHMLSSQIACVNHLYAVRQRRDLASAMLNAIDPEIVEAEIVDDGFVEFEFIGKRPYLDEPSFSRGNHCTSIDAFMIGRTAGGERRAFLIEWKYTESYRREDKYKEERAKRYDALITHADSPFIKIEPQVLYFEPFYQMMRQTLVAWQMTSHHDDAYRCTSYRHVHVVPKQNTDFHNRITSPGLSGASVSEAWKKVLKEPSLYIGISPAELLNPVVSLPDTKSLIGYLTARYWSGA